MSIENPSIINFLIEADDAYFNGDESPLTDVQYDAMKQQAKKLYPSHSYFGFVGSFVRGEKVKLPVVMGSLYQCHDLVAIIKWLCKFPSHINLIRSHKLDGISLMLEYDVFGVFLKAYTRGDGYEGQDVTRHIIHTNIPKQIVAAYEPLETTGLLIRCEAIISKTNFDKLKQVNSSTAKYKTARNAAGGILNSTSNDLEVYQFLDIIPYEISSHKLTMAKTEQLSWLKELFGKVVEYQILPKSYRFNDIDALTKEVAQIMSDSEYELDGVVYDVDEPEVRVDAEFDSTGIDPGYAMKFKIMTDLIATKVTEVEYNATMNRLLFPTIKFEPFNYNGVDIKQTSGFSARFIVESGIGPGAIINMTRSGEVIPYIVNVITPVEPQLPSCECVWDANGTHLLTTDAAHEADIIINQSIHFFKTIGVDLMGAGNITKLYEAGIKSIEDIILLDEYSLKQVLGANGSKIHAGIAKALNGIEAYNLLGGYPSFGIGIGVRKFKALEEAFGQEALIKGYDAPSSITKMCTIDGFDTKTASKIMEGYGDFNMFLEVIRPFVTFKKKEEKGIAFAGQNIVFTGFRDKLLQGVLEQQGANVKTSVSKKTTLVVAANVHEISDKLTSARDLGIKIISKAELMEQVKAL